MCGISGFHLKNDNQHEKTYIDNKLSSIQNHRGPDYLGKYEDTKYTFFHHRLSLIDGTSNGNQPFIINNFVICFNGEIYNYKILKNKIVNHTFISNSDTEVLLAYFIEFGIDKTLDDVKGMFAFSIYNTFNHELILVRDRLGIKPLYYINSKNYFAFASESRTLARVFHIKPDSFKTIASINSSAEGNDRLSLFNEIYQLKPGNYLKINLNFQIEEKSYFKLADFVSKERYFDLQKSSQKNVVKEFDELLNKSTEEMLTCDFDMGCFVSGGIDSSLLAAISKNTRNDIQLFTTDVIGKFSEYEKTKTLSTHLNLPLSKIDFTKNDFLTNWVNATENNGAPLVYFTNGIPITKVSKLARDHKVKAVLSGEGADEFFLGYSELLTKRYKNISLLPVNAIKNLYKINKSVYKYLFPNSKNDIKTFNYYLSHGFREQTLLEEGHEIYSFIPPNERKFHVDTFEMAQKHLHGLLHRNDRMGMIHSIEVRFPFLHEEILKFALNLPLQYKTKSSFRLHNIKHPFITDKWIVREVAKKYLPKSLVHQKKNGLPIDGLNGLKIHNDFFKDGYICELLQLDKKTIKYIVEKENPYFVGKLASVEIFGLLYDFDLSETVITDKILKNMNYK